MKLLLSILALFGSSVAIHRDAIHPSHGYHVHHFEARGTTAPPSNLINALNLTSELIFHAHDYEFKLDLNLITVQWGDGAEIITEMDSEGNPTKTLPLFYRSYRGTGHVRNTKENIDEGGKCTVHFFADGRFTVMLITDSDIYSVDTNDLVHTEYPLHGKDVGHGIHMSRFSHMTLGEQHDNEHINDPTRHKLRKYMESRPGGRRLSQLIPFDNCFEGQTTNQRAIRMGLVSDPAYYGLYTQQGGTPTYTTARDTTVTDQMISELTRTSEVYSAQLRVWLLPGTIITGAAAAALPMASGSFARTPGSRTGRCTQTDGSARLTTLRQWRQTRADTNALWHLMTDCHPPPGTVGIAYIGVICHKTYGVGWTNYVSASSTWLTFAHEVGHNFGSPHSFDNGQGRTGGIMDYGDGYMPAPGVQPTANRAIAFNPLRKNDICGEIASSLASRSSSNIPPADCWTLYQTVPPTPTPAPTNPTPQPTRKPSTTTPRPTTPQPTPKPSTRMPTRPPSTRPTGGPTRRPTTQSPTNSQSTATPRPTNPPTNKPTTKNPTNKPTPRPTTPRPTAPTPQPVPPVITQVTFSWALSNPLEFGPCSPTCGINRLKLPIYVCEKTTVQPGTGQSSTVKVADTFCDALTRPTGDPVDCVDSPCAGTCGDGIVNGNEVCDTRIDRYCCKKDCSGYVFSFRCLLRNQLLDGAYMNCENDVAHNRCYLFMFQGEYFKKYRAIPGFRFFYSPAWRQALPHYGLLQNKWTTLTAVAGGRNGLVYAFNGLDYLYIDYSDESQGKVIREGNVVTDWGIPLKFLSCGSVTAADILYLRWMVLFCKQMYTYVNLVTDSASRRVYPAGRLFRGRLKSDVGVNAFYWDDRFREIRVFRGPVQEAFVAEGFAVAGASATTQSIVDTGTVISNTTCFDPECLSCTNNPAHCDQCNVGYKVLVSRCIREKILIDMTFERHSRNDAFYSSDTILATATFVDDHGGNNHSAMVFDGTTAVTVFSPELRASPKTISNFRINVFFKPSNVVDRQRLLTVDNRFNIDFSAVDGVTMKLFVKYDNLTFDCYVEKPLLLDSWNKVAVEFAGRQLITFVNGFDHLRAFQVIGGGNPLALKFNTVVIGATTGGIKGALDSFTIEEVPVMGAAAAAVQPSAADSAVLVVSIIGAVIGICLIVGLVYFAFQRGYCDCDKSADTYNATSTQQAFNNASRQQNITLQSSSVGMTSAPPVPPPAPGGSGGFPNARPPPRPPSAGYVR